MYDELAPWFQLLTPPEEYAGEAGVILELLREHVDGPLETLLELGSGGGNVAASLRRDVQVTLTDLSPDMIEVSQTINPGIERQDRHVEGLFPQATWLNLLTQVGFDATALPDPSERVVFVGLRPPVAREAALN